MRPVRKTLARLAIAGLASVALTLPAFAQTACVQPAERTAFDLRALQSKLMVVALACGQDEAYNQFVRRFQGDLGNSYRTIQSYYRRTGGQQRAMDSYITSLANEHSQDQIRGGSQFCPLTTPLFRAAMAQSSPQSLAELVSDRNVINPMTAPACPERAQPAAQRRAARPSR